MNDETLFHLALERPPGDRASFLKAACAGDDTLRIRVETLLDAHEHPRGFLARPCLPAPLADVAADSPLMPQSLSALDLSFLSPASRPDAVGRLAHYEILEVVGRGAFGVVLKAFDDKLHRVVAIKALSPSLAVSDNARQRFIREAQAAAAVNHDNVVHIYAVEETASVPYLVMEYVEGISLEERLQRQGPLKVVEILRIGLQTAEGLVAAHKQGLVHRDVKPANILLENGVERVKITDFGLARAVDDVSLTQAGLIAGTPSYMSPEQARGEIVDHRADLFSLGSVLYAMCTGQPPFRGHTSLEVLKHVCEDAPPPIHETRPGLPPRLINLVARLLAKNPADRIQSAAEVAELLRHDLAQLDRPEQTPQLRCEAKSGIARPLKWGHAAAAAVAALLLVAAITAFPQVIVRIREKGGQETEIKVPQGAKVQIEQDGKVVNLAPTPGGGVGEIRRFTGHRNHVSAVALSPDGRLAASGSHDDTVRLWDLDSDNPPRVFEGHTDIVHCVAFAADGQRLLSCSNDNTVRLWDTQTGQELQRWGGLNNGVYALAAAPTGSRALYGGWSCERKDGSKVPTDCAIRLIDLNAQKELGRLEGHTGRIKSLAFSSDGRRVLSGASSWDKKGQPHDTIARLWDLDTMQEVRRFEGHTQGIEGVALSPDGRLALSASLDRTVRLWDVETAHEIRRLTGHNERVTCVSFLPDSRRAIGCGGGSTIWLWDLPTGRLLRRLPGHSGEVLRIALSTDGRRALSGSGSPDLTMRLWQLPLAEK